MKNKSNLIFYKSKPGRIGVSFPDPDINEFNVNDFLNSDNLKADEVDLPELSEPEVVRHFTNLSTMNHHIDKGFYPIIIMCNIIVNIFFRKFFHPPWP